MDDRLNLLALFVSDAIIITLFFMILFTQKSRSQLKTVFLLMLGSIGWWVTPLIFKIFLQDTNINPYTFEWISGIGNYLAPLFFIALSNIFVKTKIKLKPWHFLIAVIPIISIILLITNDSHHLLFEHFSLNFNEIVYGKFYTITIVYMYALYLIGMGQLLFYMLKNSNFFSKQSLCIIIGAAIPLTVNILGTLNIIKITTYTTPISFSFTMLFFALAIFKFNFLRTTPIALQRIVDRISDSYIILNEDYEIVDYNKTFLEVFNQKDSHIRGKNIFEFYSNLSKEDLKSFNRLKEKFEEIKESQKTVTFEEEITSVNRFFTIEINNLFAENNFIGTLILFKDITQHKRDMETIQNNQQMLIERERLASLGQMVGGIAHSLKTPIFSISGGIEGISDLIKEFDESIEDPNVNNQDMHEIAKDMNVWIDKMKGHLSYMSEVITAVKGQAVNLSGDDKIQFTVSELFRHTNILMKHEFQNALVKLEIKNEVDDDVILTGNINSLIQVLNNLLSNAIQAYNGALNQKIELAAYLKDSGIVIMIKDYGPGLPAKVKNKLFKEMITTKGKEGTGLGLFMSYSMIKAKFNGDITFDTSENGTTFYIYLPV